MTRIADALTRYAPDNIEIVHNRDDSELEILYAVNSDTISHVNLLKSQGADYAVIQCCLAAEGVSDISQWANIWKDAVLVYSYYDLHRHVSDVDFNFYYAPLGIDQAFIDGDHKPNGAHRRYVMTTGYVSHPRAEAIEEVWLAAEKCDLSVIHIGPEKVEGVSHKPANVTCVEGVGDKRLATYYSHAKYVCSLRHVEGFELPAAEGLACGARGVTFDQPDLIWWYEGTGAVFVKESSGDVLIDRLTRLFQSEWVGVSEDNRSTLLNRMDWKKIADGFWSRIMKSLGDR